ncbi:MAG: metal-sensing transcriptional repressor [Planctomycetes bacterium]|nr:metal-sensing transcriptional repressor [Planctomycetota bacterium]
MSHRHRHRTEADRRLSRIAGHVQAIRRMILDDRDCPELLVQLGAVRAAIEQVGRIVLKDHLAACLPAGRKTKALRELSKALDRFVR